MTVPKIEDLVISQYLDKNTQRNNSPARKGKILLPKYPINWEPNNLLIEGLLCLNKSCHLNALIQTENMRKNMAKKI